MTNCVAVPMAPNSQCLDFICTFAQTSLLPELPYKPYAEGLGMRLPSFTRGYDYWTKYPRTTIAVKWFSRLTAQIR